MFLQETTKGNYSLYQSVKSKHQFVKYIGKSKEDAEVLLELYENRPDLLLGRSLKQAIIQYKKEKQKLELAQIQLSSPDLRHGDFREICLTLEANSIDCIITDPPYGESYLPLYSALAETASRLLKPGGSLLIM